MPFCTQCARPLDDASRFCPACGAAVPGRGEVMSEEATRTSTEPPPLSGSAAHGRFEPGTRVGTRYRIVALLGRGGMGEVYRADDLELGQSVALKFLPRGVADNPSELARFRNEVRTARLIAHPNVCRVYDIGEADGHVFLSMEYIDGEDLASVLRRMGRPTPDKALEIARQITLGVAAAHEAGMLHRDLKPANVMIDGRGRARVTDFGLAGLAAELSKRGEIAGTPAYMSPEQLAGQSVSTRSDVSALGLLLYELFTGKRAFAGNSLAEIRRLRESDSITSPSDLAHDVDPAVERLILHCLERNPDHRPPSAYAVLGALPGGDPLAAALAAGETPSPELVANARDRGGMHPAGVAACVVLTIASLAAWGGLIGPELRSLSQPADVLSVRAADVLAGTGSFGELPPHSAHGFDLSYPELEALRIGSDQPTPIYFWRRWSSFRIQPAWVHTEIPRVDDPYVRALGDAFVLLDPHGRLIGLRTLPHDTIPPLRNAAPASDALWSAAGLDPAALAPAPLPLPVPSTVDSASAWRGVLPWNGDSVTVQIGTSRGRVVHFSRIHAWGATTAAVDRPWVPSGDLLSFVFLTLLPLLGSVYFGARNLQLRRGDWRAATRIAVFVLVATVLQAVLVTRMSEVHLLSAAYDWFEGRALGHALVHAVGIWLAYVALEPYLRRLWPRMLVSWTRLLGGRLRDPLVGRDVLIGGTAGALMVGLGVVAEHVLTEAGRAKLPTHRNNQMLDALAGLPQTLSNVAWSASGCVLHALQFLVLLLILRLIVRRTGPALALTVITIISVMALQGSVAFGWTLATITALLFAIPVILTMAFGLLAGVTATFVGFALINLVPSLDVSAWYSDRALVPLLLVLGLMVYGAVTALAGRSLFGDPLREPAR